MARVQVANVNDIALGTWSGQATMANSDNMCVLSEVCFFIWCWAQNYNVEAWGDGPGNQFTLSNGGNEISYNAFFNDQAGIGGRVQLTEFVRINNQTGADSPRPCNAVNANFSIDVNIADIASVPPGFYQGQLNFIMRRQNNDGENANGSLNITLMVGDVVQINGLNQVNLMQAGVVYSGNESFCIYRNGGTSYQVNVTSGNGGAGTFQLDSVSDTASYVLDYDDDSDASAGGVAMTSGTPQSGFVGTANYYTTSAACSGNENASIYISANVSEFGVAETYNDTLTIEIIPN